MAEELEKLLEIYNKADFIPPFLKDAFEILFGIALVSILLGVILKSFPARESIGLLRFLQGFLSNFLRGINGALDDPIEHKWLSHAKHIGNIIFSCSGFVIFLILSIVFAGVLITNAEQIEGLKRLIAPLVVAIPVLFALFFKAETGRAVVAYREWRNGI